MLLVRGSLKVTLYRMINEFNSISVHIDMFSGTLTKFINELKSVFNIILFFNTTICMGFRLRLFYIKALFIYLITSPQFIIILIIEIKIAMNSDNQYLK